MTYPVVTKSTHNEPNQRVRQAGVVDEEASLLATETCAYNTIAYDETYRITRGDGVLDQKKSESRSIGGILVVLLIGVFVSQADTTLVLATYGPIASEFDTLRDASWLLSSYMLAMCVAQPLYGKLSDIFGRKAMLQVSYGLFATGSACCGLCQSMAQLIAARSIQGLGGAGMVCLVSILLTDLVPLRDVATYRSYVNVVQTVGRSSGGAIGGLLAEVFGWRWTLFAQAPLTVFAMSLVAWKLQVPSENPHTVETGVKSPVKSGLKRVDFLGAFFMSVAILTLLLILDIGGDKVPWASIVTLVVVAISILSGLLFVITEMKWAKEPIFPLRLLTHYDVATSYSILALQNASQTALMFFIPLYFQVTKKASPAEAGIFMIPSIIGNTVGGLMTGLMIKKYGRYKPSTITAGLSSALSFALLLALWRGNDAPWISLLTFPAGFGAGTAHSSVFVALSAGVDEEDMAIAGSGLYLSGSAGAVSGLCVANALFHSALRSGLEDSLVKAGIPDSHDVARRAWSDIEYVQGLEGKVHELVVGVYISSFQRPFMLCIFFAAICCMIAVFSREKRLA